MDFPTMREVSRGTSHEYEGNIRKEFETLLREQNISCRDWFNLTAVDFPDHDQMYAFLRELYEYIYNGGEEPSTLTDL